MIIGFGYEAKSGKDTAADFLVRDFGFKRVAFADALKEACSSIFGLSKEQLYGDLKETEDAYWKDTPRNIMQKVGTECLREGYSQDVWIRAAYRRISEDLTGNWVITDVRFPNEGHAVIEWGGKLVLVDRKIKKKLFSKNQKHASETSMADWKQWHHMLDNNGTLDDLRAKVGLMAYKFGLVRNL